MPKFHKIIKIIIGSFCLLQAFFPIFDVGSSFLDMFGSLKAANNRELICLKSPIGEMSCELKEISLAGKLIRKETFKLQKVEERKTFVPHCFFGNTHCLDELYESVYLLTDKYSISFYDEVLQKQSYVHRLQMTGRLRNFVEKQDVNYLEIKEDGSFKASLFFFHGFLCLFWIALGIGLFGDLLPFWPKAVIPDEHTGEPEDTKL